MSPELDRLFHEAYVRLHGPLVDYANGFLHDRDRACDTVDDALAEVYHRWPMMPAEQRSDRYFYRAVRNGVVDALKERNESLSLDDADGEIEAQAVRAFEAPSRFDSAADALDLVLASMPPRRREVLLLLYEERLSYAETAEVLGLRPATVNAHLSLALKTIRSAFVKAGFQIEDFKPARLPAPKGDAQ